MISKQDVELYNGFTILIFFKAKETKPDLANLSTLLNSSSFNGLEYESMIDPKTLYNWERLQSELQASDYELRRALADFLIADIDGNNFNFYWIIFLFIQTNHIKMFCFCIKAICVSYHSI